MTNISWVVSDTNRNGRFSVDFLFNPPPGWSSQCAAPDFWDTDLAENNFAGALITRHDPYTVWRLTGEAVNEGTPQAMMLARWPD